MNEIDNDNTENDCLQNIFKEREVFCDTLINFIEAITPNTPKNTFIEESEDTGVISIDAKWGFGKTTFLHFLKKKLENKNFTVFTFNAWENDFEKSPFIALIQELLPQMMKAVDYDKEKDTKIKDLIDNIVLFFNEVIYSTSNAISVTTPTGYNINFNGLDLIEKKKRLNESKEKLKSIYPNENYLDVIDNKSYIRELKEQFELRLNLIFTEIKELKIRKLKNVIVNFPSYKIEEINNKRIIILIDELDRCNPIFAIELLEIIKHFFNTGKYLFIFAINSEQLINIVQQRYGSGFNETGYFRRFFDYEFYLPEPDVTEYLTLTKKVLEKEFDENKSLINYVHNSIPKNLSLRDYEKMNKFIKQILIIQNKSKLSENEIIFLTFGIIIKFISKQTFKIIFIKRQNIATQNIEKKFPFSYREFTPKAANVGWGIANGINLLIKIRKSETKINDLKFSHYNKLSINQTEYNLNFVTYSKKDKYNTPVTYIKENDKSDQLDHLFDLERLINLLTFGAKL